MRELTSGRTADEIEARGPEMIFRSCPGGYREGEGVSVTSRDRYVFIGEVSDVDDHGDDDCQMSPHIHVSLM